VQGPGLRELRETFVERADLLNRPLRTRMVGGVGAGGSTPPATRLAGGLRVCTFSVTLRMHQ
jgi:hypothetical protein